MKSCDRIARYAHRYQEGAVTQHELAEITAHLQSCPQCSAAYAWAKRTRETLHNLPIRKPSANFDIVLHAKMRQAAHESRSFWPLPLTGWGWQIPAYGATAALLIAAGIFIDRQRDFSTMVPVAAKITSMESAPAEIADAPAASSDKGTAASKLSPNAANDAGGKAVNYADSNAPLLLGTQTPVKRYVIQKIPMQTLLRESRLANGNRQASMEKFAYDTMQVRDMTARRVIPGLHQVNASVQF